MAQTFLEFIDNQRQPAAATAPNPEHQGFLDFVDRQQGTATAKPNAHQQGFLDFIKLQKPPNTPAPPKSGPAPANAPGRGHGGVDLNNPDIPDQFSQTDEAARLQAAGTPARDLEQQTPSWTGEALPAAAQKIKAVGQGFLKTFAAVGNAPESGGLPMTYEDLQTTPREQYEAVKQDAQQQAELAEKSAQNLTGKQQTAVALAGTAEDLALKGLAYALAGQAIAPLAAPALKAAGAISNPVARVATKALIHGAKTGAEMAAVDASLNPENPLEAGKSGFVSGAALGPIGEVAGEVAGRVAKTGLGQKLTRAGLEALGMGGLTAAQKPKDKTWSEWAPEIASQALVGGFFGLKSETPAMDKAEWIGRQQKKLGDLGVRVDRQDLNDVHDRMQAADEKTAPLIWNNFFDQHAAAQEKENRDWSFARSDMKLAAGQDGVWTEPHQWEPNWSAESDPTNRETLNREPSYEKRLWRDPDTGRILYSDSETTREATPEEAQALQDQTQAYKDNGILIDPKTGERIGWKTPQNETMAQDSAVPPPVPSETFAMDDGKGGQIRYERAQNGSLWIIRSSGERQPLPPGQAQRIESRRTGQTNVLAPGIEYSKVYEEDGRGHTIYRVNGEWWDHSVNTDPKAKNPEERIEPLEPSRADKEEQAYQERKSGEPWKQGTADGLRGENTPAAPVSPWEPARKVTFSNPEVPENPNGYHVVKKGNRNYLIYDGTGKMVSAFNPSEAAANGKLASLIEESRRRFQEQKQAQQNAAPQNMAIQTNDGSSGPPPMPGKPSQPPADEVIVKSNGKKYLPSQLRLKLADLKKNGVEAEPVEFTDLPEKEKARWGYRILNAGGATTVNNPQAGMEPHPLETKATSAAAQVPPEGGTVNLTTPEGGDITKAVPAAPIQTQPPAAEGTSAYGDAGRNDPGLAAGSAERSQNQPVPAQPGAGEQRPAGALGRFQDAFNAGRNANRYRIGPAELTPEEQPLYDILSQLTGRPVQKVRELDGKAMPNGALHEGTIYISDKANDPVLAVGLHEALHDMARSSPDLYQQVMDAYADLARAGQTDAAAASRHQRGVNRARAERGLEPLGDPALREEMLADLAADYAMEKGFWQRLVQKSPEAFQKLAGKILNFFDRMIEALAGRAYEPRIKDQLLLSVQARERMRQAIGDAVSEHSRRMQGEVLEVNGRTQRPVAGLENMNGSLLSERLARLGGLSEELASEMQARGVFDGMPEGKIRRTAPSLYGEAPGPVGLDDLSQWLAEMPELRGAWETDPYGRPGKNDTLDWLADNWSARLRTGEHALRSETRELNRMEEAYQQEAEREQERLDAMTPEERAADEEQRGAGTYEAPVDESGEPDLPFQERQKDEEEGKAGAKHAPGSESGPATETPEALPGQPEARGSYPSGMAKPGVSEPGLSAKPAAGTYPAASSEDASARSQAEDSRPSIPPESEQGKRDANKPVEIIKSKPGLTLNRGAAIMRVIAAHKGGTEPVRVTEKGLEYYISRSRLSKMTAELGEGGQPKPFQRERIAAIQSLDELARVAVEHGSARDDGRDTHVEQIRRFYAPFEYRGKLYRVRLLAKEFAENTKQKPTLHSLAMEDLEVEEVPADRWASGGAGKGLENGWEGNEAGEASSPSALSTLSIGQLLPRVNGEEQQPQIPFQERREETRGEIAKRIAALEKEAREQEKKNGGLSNYAQWDELAKKEHGELMARANDLRAELRRKSAGDVEDMDANERKIMAAYPEAKTDGFSDVEIAKLKELTGLTQPQIERTLRKMSAEGKAVLSLGDWSLSTPEARAAGIELLGQKHLLVRFKDNGEAKFQERRTPGEMEVERQRARGVVAAAATRGGGKPADVEAYGKAERDVARGKERESKLEQMRRAVEKATDQPYGQDMTRWKVQPDPDGSWSIVDEKGQAQATGIISKRRAENKLGTMRKPKTAAQAIGETVSRVSKRSFAAGQEHALATGNTIWEDKIGAKLDQESRPQTIQELVDMSIGQGKRLGKEEVYAQSRLPEDVARAAVNDVLEATKGDDKTRTQRLMEMHDALAQAEMRDEKMNPEEAARKGLEAMIKNPARRAALLASKGGKAGEVLGALRKVLDKALNEHFGKELARMMRKNPQRLYNSELVGRWENIAGEKTPLGKLATTAKSYRLAKGKLEKWKALNRPAGEIEKQQALVDEIKQRLGQMSRKINWQEARTAFNELSTIWQESRSMREKVLEDQDTTRGEIVTRAEKESINARDPLEEWTKEGKTPERMGFFRDKFVHVLNFKNLTSYLGGGDENSAMAGLGKNVQRTQEGAMTDEANLGRELDAAIKKEGFKETDIVKMAGEEKDYAIGGKKYKFTDAQLMSLYNLLRDPEASQKLAANGFLPEEMKGAVSNVIKIYDADGKFDAGMTLTEAKKLTDNLSQQQQNLAAVMAETLSRYAMDKGNAMDRQMLGYETFRNGFHWRMKVERGDKPLNSEMEVNSWADPKKREETMVKAGWKAERVPHSHPLLIEDAFSAFRDQSRTLARYSNMARAVTDMFTVLADPKVAEPLKLRFGTKTLNLIVDQVKREAGLKDAQPQGMLGRISGQLYRPFAIKTLATRVTSYVNNRLGGAMSMATELAKLDPKAGTQFWNMARLMKPNAGFYLTDSNREIYNKLMQNGYLYARWAGDRTMTYGGALEDRETLKSEKKMWWRNLQNKALAPMAHAEAINAINAFKVLRNQGYTEERAVKMVEVLTRRTQNASTTLEDSALGIEMREKGYNLAVPFFNQTITQANMFFEDVIAWRGAKRKGDAAAQARAARNIWIDVRGLAAGSIALAGVSAIISLGRQGYPRADEKKKKKLQAQALINLVGGSAGRFADGIIPGASSLADNAARGLVQALEADEDKRLSAVQKAATGFFTDSGRAPMAQAAGNAQDLINQGFAIIKGHRQHKDLESWRIQKAMGDIEDLLTTAIGAPTGGTEQAGSFLYGAFTGQTWGRNPKKE